MGNMLLQQLKKRVIFLRAYWLLLVIMDTWNNRENLRFIPCLAFTGCRASWCYFNIKGGNVYPGWQTQRSRRPGRPGNWQNNRYKTGRTRLQITVPKFRINQSKDLRSSIYWHVLISYFYSRNLLYLPQQNLWKIAKLKHSLSFPNRKI